MIAYFDTSALLPLVVEESGSARAGAVWDGAERLVTARVAYPEGRAETFAIRGCDAVHLAAAETVADPDTVLVAGDGQLCAAARGLGLAVARIP